MKNVRIKLHSVKNSSHNFKYLTRVAGLIISATLLTACGSGGDNANTGTNTNPNTNTYTSSNANTVSSQSSLSNNSVSSASSSSVAAVSTITTDTLVAAPDFDFNNQYPVQLIVNFQNHAGKRFQVSLYASFQETNTGYLPHFNSKITSGTLNSGEFTSDLQLPSTQTTVLAELWTYDGSAPVQALLNVENGQIHWNI
jgi:hypothetical protein